MIRASVSKQRKTLKQKNKICIVKNHLKSSTEAHDQKLCEKCEVYWEAPLQLNVGQSQSFG